MITVNIYFPIALALPLITVLAFVLIKTLIEIIPL